jgi:hypothetical protein
MIWIQGFHLYDDDVTRGGEKSNKSIERTRKAHLTHNKAIEQYATMPTLTDMASCRTNLGWLVRSLAAVTLLVWLSALVLCSVDCCVGDADCHSCHHDEQAAASHRDQAPDSDNHDGHDDSACVTVKTLVPTANSLALIKPDFGFCTLSFILPLQVSTAAQIETSVSRQPPDREWLFTPLVCLGPAFRSLAPPVPA